MVLWWDFFQFPIRKFWKIAELILQGTTRMISCLNVHNLQGRRSEDSGRKPARFRQETGNIQAGIAAFLRRNSIRFRQEIWHTETVVSFPALDRMGKGSGKIERDRLSFTASGDNDG